MKWIAFVAVILFGCKTTTNKNDLIHSHIEKSYVHLIKIPPGSRYVEWFNGGILEISKLKKGRTLLQFENSGTINHVRILVPSTGEFKSIEECDTVKEISFNTQEGSSIDITDMWAGTYWIEYGSCNLGGTYILKLK